MFHILYISRCCYSKVKLAYAFQAVSLFYRIVSSQSFEIIDKAARKITVLL